MKEVNLDFALAKYSFLSNKARSVADFQERVEKIVLDCLLQINTLWQRLIKDEFTLYSCLSPAYTFMRCGNDYVIERLFSAC